MTNSTAAKRTGVSSWKHLIDVHLNFTLEYDKKVVEGCVFLITTVRTNSGHDTRKKLELSNVIRGTVMKNTNQSKSFSKVFLSQVFQ